MQKKLTAARMVEDVVGCKWSLSVLGAVRGGIRRPGAMQRAIAGISTKVMNERLEKLQRYGVLRKESHAEVPPRVEYFLTDFGAEFLRLLDEVERLQQTLDAMPSATDRE